ncbi:MAG: mechanosensitive ion channel family protein, partial [Anaerolineales bacterium]
MDEILDRIEDFSDTTRDSWNEVPLLVQELLIFIALLMVVLVVRRIISRVIVRSVKRAAKVSKQEWDDLIINTIERPLRYATYAAAIAIGVVLLDADGMVGDFATRIASSLVIVALFMLVYAVISYFTGRQALMERATGIRIDDQLLPFVRTGLRVVLIALAIVIILNEWGYDVNGLIAGLGIGGLAVALAAQETLANLFGFTTIVGDQPLVEGEYIVTPDVEGIVEKVGLRSTRIRRLDQGYVTIPNSMLASSVITNWSRLNRRRVDFVIGVTYSTDSGQMRDLLHQIRAGLAQREKVQPET